MAVEVVKVIVAVPSVAAALLMVKAVAASATTQPTQGVLTYTAMKSLLVSIFKPVVPPAVAVTAAFAARVRPVHVTVTDPAARAEVKTNEMPKGEYVEVETTEAGEVMLHMLLACAVTRPGGKVRITLLSVA